MSRFTSCVSSFMGRTSVKHSLQATRDQRDWGGLRSVGRIWVCWVRQPCSTYSRSCQHTRDKNMHHQSQATPAAPCTSSSWHDTAPLPFTPSLTLLPHLSGNRALMEARMPFLALTESPVPGTGSSAVSR